MPSVTIYFDPQDQDVAPNLHAFGEGLVHWIESALGAEHSKIQIMALPLVAPPIGRRVYIEIKARDNEERGDAVLEHFVAGVDERARTLFGTPCRIRYFKYPGAMLVAAN